jgi:hypothetical protein
MISAATHADFSKPLAPQKKPDFVCLPGDPRVKKYGWIKSKFEGYLSFVPEENTIYVSSIWSKQRGRGNFSHLVKNIRKAGFTVKVPSPSPLMEGICKHLGFINKPEFFPEIGETIECYVLGGA